MCQTSRHFDCFCYECAVEIKKIKKELYDIIAFHTGKTYEEVARDSDRDFWMSAEEAKAYGLVDEVLLINPRKQKKENNLPDTFK